MYIVSECWNKIIELNWTLACPWSSYMVRARTAIHHMPPIDFPTHLARAEREFRFASWAASLKSDSSLAGARWRTEDG